MGEEIDIEALQAQIDLSNSIAYDLVSSWMKSSSKQETESVSKAIARDLEEHAKRPPRLGLGASASKASVATSREAARLKGKLIGAKRARQESGEGTSTFAAGFVQDDEDEGESRSAAISTKRPRMNGAGGLSFGVGGGNKGKNKATVSNESGNEIMVEESHDDTRKKRRRKHEDDLTAQDASTSKVDSTPSKRNPFVVPNTPFSNTSTIDLTSPSPARADVPAEDPTSPKKKKKKKHKKKHKDEGKDDNAAHIEDEEWHGFSDEVLELSVVLDEESPGLDHQALPSMTASPHPAIAPKFGFSSPSSVIDLTSPVRPTPSPSRVPLPKSPTREAIPLLNLQGPPTSDTEEEHRIETGMVSKSPKRKRPKRRRGKGRKSQGGEPGE